MRLIVTGKIKHMLQKNTLAVILLGWSVLALSLSSCKPKPHTMNVSDPIMKALPDSGSGQIIIWENDTNVLLYNYQTVYEIVVIRPDSEQGKELGFSPRSGVSDDEYL